MIDWSLFFCTDGISDSRIAELSGYINSLAFFGGRRFVLMTLLLRLRLRLLVLETRQQESAQYDQKCWSYYIPRYCCSLLSAHEGAGNVASVTVSSSRALALGRGSWAKDKLRPRMFPRLWGSRLEVDFLLRLRGGLGFFSS